jgi:hypothetical protein
MSMVNRGRIAQPRVKRLTLDEALRRLAVGLDIRAPVASHLVEAMLVKDHV